MRVLRRPKVRREGFGDWHRVQLLLGFDWFGRAYGEGPTFDEAAARADWAAVGPKLVAAWIADPATWTPDPGTSLFRQPRPGGPGSRPWGWWTWEAPEPRRIVAGEDPGREVWPRLWRSERWRHFFLGMRSPVLGGVEFETEREYLARLGLMGLEERAGLPAHDPESALDSVPLGTSGLTRDDDDPTC